MGFSSGTPAVLTYPSSVTTFYVNANAGSDDGAATIADPLKTFEKALKNIYARRLNGDDTRCTIYLSGASGDIDVLSPITYDWPAKYTTITNIGIYGWDDRTGGPGEQTHQGAFLMTGSTNYWVGTHTQDFTVYDGGSKLTLFTDSGESTAADFGTQGTLGVLSSGYLLRPAALDPAAPDATLPPGSATSSSYYRAVAHNYSGNGVLMAGRDSVSAADFNWSSATGYSPIQIGKPGVKIDIGPGLSTTLGNRGSNKNDIDFTYIELVNSEDNDGFNPRASVVTFAASLIYTRIVITNAGMVNLTETYFRPPTANFGFIKENGILQNSGIVVDGRNVTNYVRMGSGRWQPGNYFIFQNFAGNGDSDSTIVFNRGLDVSNRGQRDITVWTITASCGPECNAQTHMAGAGGGVRTFGEPIRIIGDVPSSGPQYSLSLLDNSVWSWHSGSIVMQSDLTTEALISVDGRQSSGSADIIRNAYILNYTSSIDRGSGTSGFYPTFQTSWSSSYATILEEAT